MSTIEIKNLTKRYGEAEVLSNINMKLESGKIYGLVGRNGSGKTMLMKHILGFVKATQGTILINGKAVGENDDMQENIGAIIENPGFLPEYSGFTNLKLLAMIQGKIKDEQIKDAISCGARSRKQKGGRKVFTRYAPTPGTGAGIDGKSRYFAVR